MKLGHCYNGFKNRSCALFLPNSTLEGTLLWPLNFFQPNVREISAIVCARSGLGKTYSSQKDWK
jgi:hypothetical protein